MQRQEIKTNVAIRNLKGKMHTQTGISDIHPEHFCVILHMLINITFHTCYTCSASQLMNDTDVRFHLLHTYILERVLLAVFSASAVSLNEDINT